MTILESFARIPAMFYISIFFLPVVIYGYFTFSKPKKKISAAAANPADVLRMRAIDVKREFRAVLFLGASIAFGAGLLISISILIGDYKNSRGLFAETLSAAAFPPAMNDGFPPVPPDADKAE